MLLSLEKISLEVRKHYKPVIIWENWCHSDIYFSILLFNYTQMKMINLSSPPENMNSIREACSIVGTPAITAFVGNSGQLADSVCLTWHDLRTSETKWTFSMCYTNLKCIRVKNNIVLQYQKNFVKIILKCWKMNFSWTWRRKKLYSWKKFYCSQSYSMGRLQTNKKKIQQHVYNFFLFLNNSIAFI